MENPLTLECSDLYNLRFSYLVVYYDIFYILFIEKSVYVYFSKIGFFAMNFMESHPR